MIDLNALRVFEKVASLLSFSAAARALGAPKSSVSRAISTLEAELGTRLLQRTTHTVVLTEPGVALHQRCADLLARADEAVDYVSSFGKSPRGMLRISAGVGFGINILSELLPAFLVRYPAIDVSLELTGQLVDLIASSVDVAVRLGPMPSSGLVARKLGTMNRYLCASPAYLARKGTPRPWRSFASTTPSSCPAWACARASGPSPVATATRARRPASSRPRASPSTRRSPSTAW